MSSTINLITYFVTLHLNESPLLMQGYFVASLVILSKILKINKTTTTSTKFDQKFALAASALAAR